MPSKLGKIITENFFDGFFLFFLLIGLERIKTFQEVIEKLKKLKKGEKKMAILVGIDGTGSSFLPFEWYRKKSYDQKYANSFVRKICKTINKPFYQYIRGPAVLGGGLVSAISTGVSFILRTKKRYPTERILLTGFSRGAAGVVAISQELKKKNINVDAMLLFDCVDRHAFINSASIPNNVKAVLHALRCSYTGSRKSFSYSAMNYTPPTKCEFKFFECTHGAMGGIPSKPKKEKKPEDKIKEDYGETLNLSYAQNAETSKKVWKNCLPFMRTHRFI